MIYRVINHDLYNSKVALINEACLGCKHNSIKEQFYDDEIERELTKS